MRTFIEIVVTMVWIAWPFAWLLVLFLQGYTRIKYPEAYPGVGPYNEEAIKKEQNKGWLWVSVSLLAELIWFAAPMFF